MTDRRETPQQYADRIAAWMAEHPGQIHPERRDRFGDDWDDEDTPTFVTPPLCSVCANLTDRELWRCRAFPDGIPSAILAGDFDHRKPYLGDGGVRFEPRRAP